MLEKNKKILPKCEDGLPSLEDEDLK